MTASSLPALVLFSPNPIIGGTEVIFARLGERASERGWDVHVVDQAGGAFAPLVRSRRGDAGLARETVPGRPACIVTTPKYLTALCDARDRLPSDSRVLIYQVHPYEWVSALFPGFFRIATSAGEGVAVAWTRLLSAWRPSHRAAAADLLHALGRGGALACMDGPCRDATGRFLALPRASDAPAMPVVALPTEARAHERRGRPAGVRPGAAYFGRVSDFKTATVVRVIEDLAATTHAAGADLHVIGDGDGVPAARAAAQRVATSGLRVVFHGAMPLPEAQALMAEQADVVFAMGSSALDAAVLGLPVFLVNPLRRSDRRTPVFGGWLCDQSDASLGAYEPTRYSARPLSIGDALVQWPPPDPIGAACRSYALTVHDAAANADALLDLAGRSSIGLDRFVQHVGALRGAMSLRRSRPLSLEVVTWPRSC